MSQVRTQLTGIIDQMREKITSYYLTQDTILTELGNALLRYSATPASNLTTNLMSYLYGHCQIIQLIPFL